MRDPRERESFVFNMSVGQFEDWLRKGGMLGDYSPSNGPHNRVLPLDSGGAVTLGYESTEANQLIVTADLRVDGFDRAIAQNLDLDASLKRFVEIKASMRRLADQPAREGAGELAAESGGPGRPPGITIDRLIRLHEIGELKKDTQLTGEEIAERLSVSVDAVKADWRDYRQIVETKDSDEYKRLSDIGKWKEQGLGEDELKQKLLGLEDP